VIAAKRNGQVVGYLVFGSLAAQSKVPIVQAMLKAYPGTPDAYNYGPVCVAESERGRGLAGEMFAALRALFPEREAVAFIRGDNAPSLSAHTKMGMQQVAEFTHDGIEFVVMAHSGRSAT
jgi:hypothetical protein